MTLRITEQLYSKAIIIIIIFYSKGKKYKLEENNHAK